MPSTRKTIVRICGVATLAVAVVITFIPGSPLGSVWTHSSPLPGMVEVPGAWSSMALRSNQLPLALAAIAAVVGTTLLVIAGQMRDDGAPDAPVGTSRPVDRPAEGRTDD